MNNFTCICVTLCVTIAITLIQQASCSEYQLNLNAIGTPTTLDSELSGQFYNLTGQSVLKITVTDINKKISFIIFQVHSYLYNVTLYKGSIVLGSTVNGTNIGLYSPVISSAEESIFFIKNFNNETVNLYISVHGYNSKAPVPGGCNMEFEVPVAPFLRVKYSKDLITLDAPTARDPKDNLICSNLSVANITYEFYRMYTCEQDFSLNEYFNGIRKMMTLEGILQYGELAPASYNPYMAMKRLFSRYPGTGSVYVVVAKSSNGTSVYVPTHTYGCSLFEQDCDVLGDILSRVVCALTIFISLFVCYFGHRFFKTEMFLVGLAAGAIFTYIVFSLIAHLDQADLMGASLISGVCFGAIWWVFWWFYGLPVFSVLLPTLVLGFVTACVLFLSLPPIEVLESDTNFWVVFICTMVAVPSLIVSATLHANILSCAIVGGYGVVYPIDMYLGSSLKYILINTVRRAVVTNFDKALTSPPFQWKDVVLVLLWVMLSITGFLFQIYHNRGKAPFPPPPRSLVSSEVSRPSYGSLSSERYSPGETAYLGMSQSYPGTGLQGTRQLYPGSRNEREPLLAAPDHYVYA